MKSELIERVAEKAGMTKAETGKALDLFLQEIVEICKKDKKMAFVGFGTFNVKERAARKGLNPLTGKPMDIPAKNVVTFKAGSKFKDALN